MIAKSKSWYICHSSPPLLPGTVGIGLTIPVHYPARDLVKFSIGVRCGYSQKPPDFSVDYDPFEDFFGLGLDMKTRKQAESIDGPQSFQEEFKKNVPCPVCRGRGYILDSPKGPSSCSYCVGKGMVLEDSVWESAWETAQTRSPLRVEDDEVLDRFDPDVPEKTERRVYGPRPEAIRMRISRTMKELEKRTGAFSKRAKRQHQNLTVHSRMVAAIKRAKSTEDARRKISEQQKLFFQNPENRRMRGLQMRGVKFSCRHCGKEGHRKHFCPKLGYVKKSRSYPTRVYRCGLCQQVGHTRRHCPLKDSVQASDPTSLIRRYKPRAKGVKRGTYKCGHCHQTGHSRRTCPKLVKKGVEDAEGWRIGKMNRCKGKRLAI